MNAETHKLQDFLDIHVSGAKKIFCPGCGVKMPCPTDELEHSCPNCGLNMRIAKMKLDIWR